MWLGKLAVPTRTPRACGRGSLGVFLPLKCNKQRGSTSTTWEVAATATAVPGQLGGFDVSKKREEGPRPPPLHFSIYIHPSFDICGDEHVFF
jgi:hypothetical protein